MRGMFMSEPVFTLCRKELSGPAPTLELFAGEVHALLGLPGSGKSALLALAAGDINLNDITVICNRQSLRCGDRNAFQRAGIIRVPQRPAFASALSWRENLSIIRTSTRLEEWLKLCGLSNLNLNARAVSPTPAITRMAAFVRAALARPRVLLLDDPAAGLNREQTSYLIAGLQRLTDEGTAVLIATRNPDFAHDAAERYTIIRPGLTLPAAAMSHECTSDMLFCQMAGCTPDDFYPPREGKPTSALLEVIGLRMRTGSEAPEISFTLRRGEILGLHGLHGNGQLRLTRLLAGLGTAPRGVLSTNGKNLRASRLRPSSTLAAGILYLDRESGLFPEESVADNLLLCARRWRLRCGTREKEAAWAALEDIGLHPELAAHSAGSLRDLEKELLLLARAKASGAEVLLLNAPARGLSARGKNQYYRALYRLADSGKGIILTGMELPEMMRVCDTLSVLHAGWLCPPRPVEKWTLEEINLYEQSGKLGALSLL